MTAARKFKSMGSMLRNITEPAMRRLQETIIANLNTLYDHGNHTGLEDDTHPQYVTKDITRHVTAGYTTDVDDAGSILDGEFLVPDFTKEHLKLLSAEGSFTLNKPGDNGHCEYFVTVDSGGPYTITEGADVVLIGGVSSLAASTNYVLNVRRFTETKVVAQLVSVP